MDAAGFDLLDALIGPKGPPLRSQRVPFGLAREGAVAWRGQQRLTSLAEVESALARAAGMAGARLDYDVKVETVTPTQAGWYVGPASLPGQRFDLLVDASGAHRALLEGLGEAGPDVWMDEIAGPEWHMSMGGTSDRAMPGMVAWSHDGLEGLLQIDEDGQVTLTARSSEAGRLGHERVRQAVGLAGGDALAKTVETISFSKDTRRYTSTATRLMALDQADLGRWPPFVLIGDALIEAPPRHGEGMGRALAQALTLSGILEAGPTRGCAVELTRDARSRWAGYGIARALRSGGAA